MTNPPLNDPSQPPSEPNAPTGQPAPYGQPQGPYGQQPAQPVQPEQPAQPQAPAQPAQQPVYQSPTAPQGGGVPPATPPVYPAGGGYTQPPAGPSVKKGLAITALILGIAAVVFMWVPILGVLLGIVGVIIGIMAMAKKQPKGLGLTGLILSAVAFIGGLVFTIIAAVALFTLGAVVAESGTTIPGTLEPFTPETEETTEPSAGEFPEVSESELAAIVADPDSYIGQEMTIYGVVVQYDEGTGPCSFRLLTSHEMKSDPAEFEHNTMGYAGDWDTDCLGFDVFAVDDVLSLQVTVEGQESYQNSNGDTITALMVEVWDAHN